MTVAMAKEIRGFFRDGAAELAGSVSGVIRLVKFQIDNYGFTRRFNFFEFVFVEDGIGDHIFFRGPVAEVAVAAAFAAKREVAMHRRVCKRFANWTFM